MEVDSFLTAHRWKILEIISRTPSSPIKLSKMIGTSVAYVSQQLKLLEAASLVKKEKTGVAEKGQSRILFSVAKDLLYLTVLSDNFSVKKVIPLTEHNKIILRIWLIDNQNIIPELEKFYSLIEDNILEINGIFMDNSSKKVKVFILTDSSRLKNKINSFSKEHSKNIDYEILNYLEDKKIILDNIYSIYDPSQINKKKEMKGGNNYDE